MLSISSIICPLMVTPQPASSKPPGARREIVEWQVAVVVTYVGTGIVSVYHTVVVVKTVLVTVVVLVTMEPVYVVDVLVTVVVVV